VFRFKDHVGGIVHDKENKSLHGVSWGSRRFYAWPLGPDGRSPNAGTRPEDLRVMNPAQYIDYQDCHYLGARPNALAPGSNNYRPKPDAPIFRLGGFEIVNLKDNRPVWQVPIELVVAVRTADDAETRSFVETTDAGLRAYFMPDDDDSTLFIYETVVK